MWVKICGNTRLEDCLAAAELCADAVGFVFAAGKRTVTASHVAAITKELPESLEKIGVFTSLDGDEIAHIAIEAGLTGIQLHSPLNCDLNDALRRSAFNGKVIQLMHWRTDLPAASQLDEFKADILAVNSLEDADAVLIDSHTAVATGGTGVAFDWNTVGPLIPMFEPLVIVAGGLKPENVADAVRVLRPWGVDVSSGVEAGTPGVKDRDAIARFIANARAV